MAWPWESPALFAHIEIAVDVRATVLRADSPTAVTLIETAFVKDQHVVGVTAWTLVARCDVLAGVREKKKESRGSWVVGRGGNKPEQTDKQKYKNQAENKSC